jgi:hypothetical protein
VKGVVENLARSVAKHDCCGESIIVAFLCLFVPYQCNVAISSGSERGIVDYECTTSNSTILDVS